MRDTRLAVSTSRIESCILLLRGRRVMLDADIAALYGVETKMLVRAVKRNLSRFPPDFMFQLSAAEFDDLRRQTGTSNLRSQSGTSKAAAPAGLRGGRRYRPYAFTEQGVSMHSSVLRSRKAVQVNIEIMRTFVRLRQMLATHAELAWKLEELERRYDAQFKVVFDAIRKLMEPPPDPPRRPIGFMTEAEREPSGRQGRRSRRRSLRRAVRSG